MNGQIEAIKYVLWHVGGVNKHKPFFKMLFQPKRKNKYIFIIL